VLFLLAFTAGRILFWFYPEWPYVWPDIPLMQKVLISLAGPLLFWSAGVVSLRWRRSVAFGILASAVVHTVTWLVAFTLVLLAHLAQA
jgi:hypothetical protein